MNVRYLKLIVFLYIQLFSMQSMFAQIRLMEPVILFGSQLTAFNGAVIEQLHLFAYKDNHWVEIPAQIDEKSPEGSLFESDDELWDENDELIFQPQDGGIPVLSDNWITDDDSQNYVRLKITVFDPVENDSVFVYLYRSSTIGDTISTNYIEYDSLADEITSENYKMGFDGVKKFWDELRIKENGQYTEDLIDRQKTRIKGQVGFTTYNLTENDYNLTGFFVKEGRVRISTRTEGNFSVLGITVPLAGIGQYYDSFLASPGNEINIHSSVNMLRNSVDLTAEAIGTTISNQNNDSLSVDGSPDADIQENITSSQLPDYWVKMRFSNSSLVTVGDMSEISNTNKLYYYDNSSGGTGDGTGDTGDMVSYGDIGVRFNNPNSGEHVITSKTYAGIGVDLTGLTCQAYFDNPLEINISEESYPPVGIEEGRDLLPPSYGLSQNYPNPFNPLTTIRYSIKEAGYVQIVIYDELGRLVRKLVDEKKPAGDYVVTWDGIGTKGKPVSSGLYFYALKRGYDILISRRMMMIK